MIINEQGESIERPRGVPAIQTRQIARLLVELGADTERVITYAELSAAAGENVQTVGRGHLESARRLALHENNYVFRPIINVGLKRLKVQDLAQLDDRLTHNRRNARRFQRELETAPLEQIPPDLRPGYIGRLTVARIHEQTAQPGIVKKFAAASNGVPRELDMRKLLEAFKES